MRYELGLIVNGKRYKVWVGGSFPEGKHDMMSNMVRVMQGLYPDHQVGWYCECDGRPYSY